MILWQWMISSIANQHNFNKHNRDGSLYKAPVLNPGFLFRKVQLGNWDPPVADEIPQLHFPKFLPSPHSVIVQNSKWKDICCFHLNFIA
jgi:hypothetical protein